MRLDGPAKSRLFWQTVVASSGPPRRTPVEDNRRYPSQEIEACCLRASPICPVDQDCRYSVPFVLGTPGIRGSASTAIRSARAVALKIASAMWWLLRP